jgi:hypothetical protein
LLVVVALVVLWLRYDSKLSFESAGPRERGQGNVTAPQELSGVAENSPVVIDPTDGRAEAAVAASQPESSVAGSNEDTASIRVRVVAKDTGAPFVGESIAARPKDATTWSTTTTKLSRGSLAQAPITDTEGRAELTVLARREHTLFLVHADQPTSLSTPALEPGEVHECVLEVPTQADLVFVGRVIDGATRAPIADAAVSSLSHVGQASVPPVDGLRSDRDGYFEVRVKSWETKLVRVEAQGYAWVAVGLVRGCESRASAFEISMSRAGVAEVVVFTHGRPTLGAKVRLSADSYNLQRWNGAQGPHYFAQDDPVWGATTDELGVVRLVDLPARVPLQLEVAHESVKHVQAESIVLAPGETRRIEVHLGAGVVVRGRLATSAGEPVAGAELWRVASRALTPGFFSPDDDAVDSVRTDEHGRFAFDDVGAGAWAIGPSAQSDSGAASGLAPVAQRVVVRGDEGVLDIVLRTDRDLYIRGQVVGPDGAPEQSHVVARHESLGLWKYANCDGDGRFEIGPLLQADYQVVAGGLGPRAASQAVTAPAGSEGLVLRLGSAGSLIVRVAPLGGEAVDASVTLERVGAEFGWMSSHTRDGVQRFDDLTLGTYVVTLRTEDRHFALLRGVEVRAGEPPTEVELSLQLGALVEVTYAGSEGACQCSLLVGGTVVDTTYIQRGTVRSLVGPAGALEVHRHTGVNTPPEVHVLTVAPGEKRVVVLGK